MTRMILVACVSLVVLGLAGCSTLRVEHDWDEQADFTKFKKLLVHPKTFDLVKSGAPLAEIHKSWQEARQSFEERRAPCLLY